MPTSTTKKEHPFLALPTELRQQILALSLSDTDILDSIELRARQSRDNIWQTNVWEIDWHSGALPHTERPMKNGQGLGKPRWVVMLEESELFKKDRVWVRGVWENRVRELGGLKRGAWEEVFGKRFRLGETLHFTEGQKVVDIEVIGILPAGMGLGSGSRQSYSIAQPGAIPPAVFDFHVLDVLRGCMERRERIGPGGSTYSITGWVKLDREGLVY